MVGMVVGIGILRAQIENELVLLNEQGSHPGFNSSTLNLFYISFLLLFLALDVSLYLYIVAHFYTQKKQYY